MADYVLSPEERADLQRILAETPKRKRAWKNRIGEAKHQPRCVGPKSRRWNPGCTNAAGKLGT